MHAEQMTFSVVGVIWDVPRAVMEQLVLSSRRLSDNMCASSARPMLLTSLRADWQLRYRAVSLFRPLMLAMSASSTDVQDRSSDSRDCITSWQL